MNKKLLGTLIATVIAAPLTAQAESVLYGRVHVSLDHHSSETVSAPWALPSSPTVPANLYGVPAGHFVGNDTGLNVSSHASRIGVKGSEYLGNGLKAIYKMEWEIDVTDNSADRVYANTGTLSDSLGETITGAVTSVGNNNHISSRTMYAGLSGSFGALVLGRLDSPYKTATDKLDVFVDTVFDYNAILGTDAGLNNRHNNTIAYVSPDFAGLSFSMAKVVDEEPGGGDEIGHAFAVTYEKAGLFLSLSSESIKDAQDGLKVGIGFEGDMGQIGLIHEHGHDSTETWHEAAIINGAIRIGANSNIIAEVGQRRWHTDTVESLWAVGLTHHFSKNTSAYVAYGVNTREKLDAGTAITWYSPVEVEEKVGTIGFVTNF